MYLDYGGGTPCRLFKKSLNAMMDLATNWIIIPSCLQQNNGFRCGIFCL